MLSGHRPRAGLPPPLQAGALILIKYIWDSSECGDGPVAVKIVDVLDEEWFEVVEG
jgi:hypothetical protein